MTNHRPSVDEARLRPHLRDRPTTDAPFRLIPPDSGMTYVQTFLPGLPTSKPTTKPKHFKPEPGDLRGIPVQAKGVSGAQPGTRPDTSRITQDDQAA